MKQIILIFLFILSSFAGMAESQYLVSKIDSLLFSEAEVPFNGVVLIAQDGEDLYIKTRGYSNFYNKEPLKESSRFVIGSITKQITAVLILQEFEKEKIELNVPVSRYLPDINQAWTDTVTVHHLLTHMHGVVDLNKPSVFPAGSQYMYSQIGYQILADIVQNINRESFDNLVLKLFRKIGMYNTFPPSMIHDDELVKPYYVGGSKNIVEEKNKIKYAPAGGFISTINDLLIWNNHLYGGKLLHDNTFQRMTTEKDGAVRNHPIFGITKYGYGVTVDRKNNLLRIGQTGYAPGYPSMNFYFPETKTSVIVLGNVAADQNDLKKIFYFQTQILDIVTRYLTENK